MTSTGTFRYSPKLNGSLERRDGGSTKWWLVLDLDPELGRYFRHLHHLATYRTQKLQRPAWETHISVIRDEEPLDEFKPLWDKYAGQEICFDYDMMNAGSNDIYVWLPVVCETALDIRAELGLPRDPIYPLHLTVGNFK